MEMFVGLAAHLVLETLLLAYFFGRMSEKVSGLDSRVTRIEDFVDRFLRGLVRAEFEPEVLRREREKGG
jgi:hypothetical protein